MYQETIPWRANYEEKEIPDYVLPKLLLSQNGTRIDSVEQWEKIRRPELLKLFQRVMYGTIPPAPDFVEYEAVSQPVPVYDGLGFRRETRLRFRMKNGRGHAVLLLLYTPAASQKSPVFVNLTFQGNHVVSDDPAISKTGLAGDGADHERGSAKRRYPLEFILQWGYAVAIVSYHDFFPDREDGWQESIYRLFHSNEALTARPADASAISAWAWGFSRMLDYLETLPEIDHTRAALCGHSRLGKAALWAGVNDSRFRLVGVNDSGCGGAALSRRLFGETLFSMFREHSMGKWWFTDTLEAQAGTPQNMPIDQHELIALCAPRAVAIHSATGDRWADPKSEYLSAFHASPAFRLYGLETLPCATPPVPETPVGSVVSYYLRDGEHDLLRSDWEHYMDMADRIFRK